tara:strand:+ start:699 stop:1328 length:630 start_codon:yes stop_codon:yes gene_type:complete
MEETNPVHINIYKENQNSIDTSSNRTEAYIILSNEELNNKNRDLLEKVAESNAEKDILEDENERMEKSITYQRGLLHNFNTLNKLERLNSSNQENISKKYQEQIKELENLSKEKDNERIKLFGYLGVMLLLQTSFGILDSMIIVILSINIITVVYILMYVTTIKTNPKNINSSFNEKRNQLNKDIEKNKTEIKSIMDSSDFISDYIENM